METALLEVQRRLGHVFAKPWLLIEALTHPSYFNENPAVGAHNQRLEFLGDAILQLILSEALFAADSAAPEGELSRRRAALANGRMLATLAADLGLAAALRLGGSENTPEGRARPSNLEDAFESVVGALYLDAGLAVARERVLALYGPLEARLSPALVTANPKGRLQEIFQARRETAPLRYHTEQSGGADHAKEYTSRVLHGETVLGEGSGFSKKAAEEAAARMALAKLGSG